MQPSPGRVERVVAGFEAGVLPGNHFENWRVQMTMFTNFLRDESGAVTIDWVALTAGILLLGIAVVYGIFNAGVTPLVQDINSALSSATSTAPTAVAPTGEQFSSTGG